VRSGDQGLAYCEEVPVTTASVIDRDLQASGLTVLASASGSVALAPWAYANRGQIADGTLHVTVDRVGRKTFSFYEYSHGGTTHPQPTLTLDAADIVAVQTVRRGLSRVVQITVADPGSKSRTTTLSVVSPRGSSRRLFEAVGFIL
jgi:hypothetical protein